MFCSHTNKRMQITEIKKLKQEDGFFFAQKSQHANLLLPNFDWENFIFIGTNQNQAQMKRREEAAANKHADPL